MMHSEISLSGACGVLGFTRACACHAAVPPATLPQRCSCTLPPPTPPLGCHLQPSCHWMPGVRPTAGDGHPSLHTQTWRAFARFYEGGGCHTRCICGQEARDTVMRYIPECRRVSPRLGMIIRVSAGLHQINRSMLACTRRRGQCWPVPDDGTTVSPLTAGTMTT